MEALANLGINLGFLVFFAVYFGLVAFVFTRWGFNPIRNILAERKHKIAQGLEDARIAGEARANAEAQAKTIIAEAQQEANRRVAEAVERAEKQAADLKAAAEADRAARIASAEDEIVAERNRVLGELRGQVAALAMAAANKVVGSALDETRQRAIIAEFFSGVKNGRIVVTQDMALSGAQAEVTSALPLTADEQATVKSDLVAKMGGGTVNFRVDPGILGGLVVRVGDKIVDGSVAGKLEGLKQAVR
jgi:F-type H+-transporting ATPase subunit b